VSMAINMRRWDLMRFLWRGKLRAHIKDVDFALGTTIDPEVTAASRRLQVLLCIMQTNKCLLDDLKLDQPLAGRLMYVQVSTWLPLLSH
jgi:hypothetical protein